MSRLSIAKEFWYFVYKRKMYWLYPIIIILIILSIFVKKGGKNG